MNAIQRQDTAQIARAAVREHFKGVPIAGVSVRPDLDHEGDPILRIGVVMGGDSLAPFRPFGIAAGTLHVWERLHDAGALSAAVTMRCSILWRSNALIC